MRTTFGLARRRRKESFEEVASAEVEAQKKWPQGPSEDNFPLSVDELTC